MVTVSSYEQNEVLESAISAAISLVVVGLMMKMASRMMKTAGPMYAKKHKYLGKAVAMKRPWNATSGEKEVRPDCRAWLFDCSCVAIQMKHGDMWIAGTVSSKLRGIRINDCRGDYTIHEHQIGEPHRIIEITKREMDDIKWCSLAGY